MTAVLNRKKNLESVFHPPPSPRVFRKRKGSQTMHSISVTPIYQPCEQGVSLLYFLCFLGFSVFVFVFVFFGGVGKVGEGVGWRGKGRSISFDLRYFFPKVIFYIIPYVRAILLTSISSTECFSSCPWCSVNHEKNLQASLGGRLD